MAIFKGKTGRCFLKNSYNSMKCRSAITRDGPVLNSPLSIMGDQLLFTLVCVMRLEMVS